MTVRPTRSRDTQKSRLYAAENAAFPAKFGPAMSWDEARAYIDGVFRSHWMRTRYPGAAQRWRLNLIRLSDGRSRTSAGANASYIALPRWSRTPIVILHEIGHVIAPPRAWHGHEYAAIYLKLVSQFLGRASHDRLRAEFKRHRVRYAPPRVGRKLSEEERAVLVARLAAYREQRAVAAVA